MNIWKKTSAAPRNMGARGTAAALVLGVALMSGAAHANAQQDRAAMDAQTESNVIVALANSNALKGQQVAAGTADGQVTLTGQVNDAASRELAETIVDRVTGVRSVINNLTVAGDSPKGSQVQDQSQAQDQNQVQNQAQDAGADQGPDPALQNLAPGDQAQGQQPGMSSGDQNAVPQNPGQAQDAPYSYPSGPAPRPDNGQTQAGGSQADGNQGYGQVPPQRPGYDDRKNGNYNNGQRGRSDQYADQDSGPVTLPASTLVRVRTVDVLDARRLQPGAMVQLTAANDVFVGGVLAIPRGASLQGVVTDVKGSTSGQFTGSSSMALKLTSLNLDNRSYALTTDVWDGRGPGKGAFSANNTIGGAAIGAVIGGIIGRGPGAAVGAVAGGATGAAASTAASGPRMVIAPETILTFHLTQPVIVNPVSSEEARRLAANQPQGRPYLRPRGYGYYPPPPPPGYYGPAYYPYGGVVYGPR